MKKITYCKDCPLFNRKEKVCEVTFIHEGEYLELKVKPESRCAWEEWGMPIDEIKIFRDEKNIYVERPEFNLRELDE